jgi:Predicted integral membrane protein (DUF2269)
MDRYHVVLFVHIIAFVVASGASAVMKLAAGRRGRARTVGEALEWHDVMESTSRLFPLCIAALVLTGFYMVGVAHAAPWAAGWVVGGTFGVVLLLATGAYLGARGKALRQVLQEMAAQGADRPAPALVPPPLLVALPPANTGIALGVAFVMVTKPASVAVALGIVALGAAVFATGALRRPAPAGATSPVAPAA